MESVRGASRQHDALRGLAIGQGTTLACQARLNAPEPARRSRMIAQMVMTGDHVADLQQIARVSIKEKLQPFIRETNGWTGNLGSCRGVGRSQQTTSPDENHVEKRHRATSFRSGIRQNSDRFD